MNCLYCGHSPIQSTICGKCADTSAVFSMLIDKQILSAADDKKIGELLAYYERQHNRSFRIPKRAQVFIPGSEM